MNINEHEGSKYLKKIHSPVEGQPPVEVDIYAVLEAFNVTCPAVAHAIKKLLMPGQRGKGGVMADLKGAQAAINRAMELEEIRENTSRQNEVSKSIEDKISNIDVTIENIVTSIKDLKFTTTDSQKEKEHRTLCTCSTCSTKRHKKAQEGFKKARKARKAKARHQAPVEREESDEPTLVAISAPIWVKQGESEITDPEVLAVLGLDLADALHKMDPEDHRYIEHIIRDAGTIFCKQHETDDLDYWSDKCFLDILLKFEHEVMIALNKAGGGTWINNEYRMAHGQETLESIMTNQGHR